jgi:hypothetical protein
MKTIIYLFWAEAFPGRIESTMKKASHKQRIKFPEGQ